jgi:hypothetical protein
VSAVVLLGAGVVGTVALKGTNANQQRNAVAVAAFIRQNHGLLTHDMAMAGGPMLDTWSRQLDLSATERQRLAVTMEGSAEQGDLMRALDGPIDEASARRFSAAFFRVSTRALGPTRMGKLVVRAAGSDNGG